MPLSRRKLLAASTGLGLACRSEAPVSLTPRFTGQSPERGHLLRSAALLDAPIDERRKAAVVIVGGGAAGFCAARRLRAAGGPERRARRRACAGLSDRRGPA
jgi:hypothetical protein